MVQLEFIAFLPAETTDFVEIWESLTDSPSISYGAKGQDYFVKYSGDLYAGLDLLPILLKNPDCRVSLAT